MPNCSYRDVPNFHIPHISPKVVFDELSKLKINTATGSDNLPAVFLVKCADVLSLPIANLFNLSIDHGVYPDVLKFNNIIPT